MRSFHFLVRPLAHNQFPNVRGLVSLPRAQSTRLAESHFCAGTNRMKPTNESCLGLQTKICDSASRFVVYPFPDSIVCSWLNQIPLPLKYARNLTPSRAVLLTSILVCRCFAPANSGNTFTLEQTISSSVVFLSRDFFTLRLPRSQTGISPLSLLRTFSIGGSLLLLDECAVVFPPSPTPQSKSNLDSSQFLSILSFSPLILLPLHPLAGHLAQHSSYRFSGSTYFRDHPKRCLDVFASRQELQFPSFTRCILRPNSEFLKTLLQ